MDIEQTSALSRGSKKNLNFFQKGGGVWPQSLHLIKSILGQGQFWKSLHFGFFFTLPFVPKRKSQKQIASVWGCHPALFVGSVSSCIQEMRPSGGEVGERGGSGEPGLHGVFLFYIELAETELQREIIHSNILCVEFSLNMPFGQWWKTMTTLQERNYLSWKLFVCGIYT